MYMCMYMYMYMYNLYMYMYNLYMYMYFARHAHMRNILADTRSGLTKLKVTVTAHWRNGS